MQDGRRALGTRGELIAVRALQEAGLRIVERNWRCRAGELDIIAEECAPDFSRGASDSRWLVVVEVRTRRGHGYGSALQSFTHGNRRSCVDGQRFTCRKRSGRALGASTQWRCRWTGPAS